jgi:hypothetical protein
MRFVRACLLLTLGACGGNVVVDGTGGATSTTTGGGAGLTTTVVTTTGVTTTGITTTSVTGCPTIPPNQGDPCPAPGMSCPMPLLCCGVTVTCTTAFTWEVPPPTCGQPCIPCGPQNTPVCSGAAVCVFESTDSAGVCRANPCASEVLTCSCAGSLCPSGTCSATMGPDVYCG